MTKKLKEKLIAIMPPEPPPISWGDQRMASIQANPVQRAAESFVGYLEGEMPQDARELRDVLFVFGKVLSGEVERQLNHMTNVAADALNLAKGPSFTSKDVGTER
jgi:hypothetical protein